MKLPPGRRGVGREPKDKSEGREIDTEVIEVVRGEEREYEMPAQSNPLPRL